MLFLHCSKQTFPSAHSHFLTPEMLISRTHLKVIPAYLWPSQSLHPKSQPVTMIPCSLATRVHHTTLDGLWTAPNHSTSSQLCCPGCLKLFRKVEFRDEFQPICTEAVQFKGMFQLGRVQEGLRLCSTHSLLSDASAPGLSPPLSDLLFHSLLLLGGVTSS